MEEQVERVKGDIQVLFTTTAAVMKTLERDQAHDDCTLTIILPKTECKKPTNLAAYARLQDRSAWGRS